MAMRPSRYVKNNRVQRFNPYAKTTRRADAVCRFWLNGACTRGASCGFAHSREEGRLSSVECHFFRSTGACPNPRCTYLHSTVHKEVAHVKDGAGVRANGEKEGDEQQERRGQGEEQREGQREEQREGQKEEQREGQRERHNEGLGSGSPAEALGPEAPRCRDYDRGFCLEGGSCRRLHVARDVCLSYLAGMCPRESRNCPRVHFGSPSVDREAKEEGE